MEVFPLETARILPVRLSGPKHCAFKLSKTRNPTIQTISHNLQKGLLSWLGTLTTHDNVTSKKKQKQLTARRLNVQNAASHNLASQPPGRTPQDLAKTPEIKELLVPCYCKLGNIHVGNIGAVFLAIVYDKSFLAGTYRFWFWMEFGISGNFGIWLYLVHRCPK